MPLYQCICTKCGNAFERIVASWKDKHRIICPRCNYAVLTLPSAPAVHFKGSGWTPRGHSK
jgi:putative FmdB family regulatory protein